MIRNLAIIAGVGFVLSICCLWGAAALGGANLKDGWTWPGRWTINDDGVHFGPDGADGPRIEGSRDLPWSGGDNLIVNLPAEVTYVQTADQPGVTLAGAADVIDRIELENGKISIPGLDNFNWRRSNPSLRNANLRITVHAPAVERFELNGAAKVEIDDYDRERMDLEVNGAAEVHAHGRAKTLKLQINGASDADLDGLQIDDANVEANGAGKVTVAATNSADIEINGVGEVILKGRPKSLSQAIHGVGRVRVEDADASASPDAPAPAKKPGDHKAKDDGKTKKA